MRKLASQNNAVFCTNCLTKNTELLNFKDGVLTSVTGETTEKKNDLYVGPGLIDLQVNGINGIDFNNPSLTISDFLSATQYLLSQGVTSFFPTIITNSNENIKQLLQVIHQACLQNPLINECVAGIHLEGPFISPVAGAKGAHSEEYIQQPDWNLFQEFQQAAGGRIKLLTMAPEWEGATAFIKKCSEHGVLVSIGHSMADSNQINAAIEAGASLSTHLGNGVPLLLPRHPNIIWDQLAAEDLYSCLIADGIHIPDAFIKVVIKVKGRKTILVSDATCFAGMPPGEYQTHIGGSVVLTEEKRVSLKENPQLLAGAAKSLLENVVTLVQHKLATLADSWRMGSLNVTEMLVKKGVMTNDKPNDQVIFQFDGKNIEVLCVVKNGRVVFENDF